MILIQSWLTGFTIQNELAPLNFELNIRLFLGGRAQLTEAEVK